MPVNISKIEIVTVDPDTPASYVSRLYISYHNKSTQQTDAVKFHIVLKDEFGDPFNVVTMTRIPSSYVTHYKTKPDKEGMTSWDFQNVIRGADVAVEKIAFKDGTVWKDDGSLSCRLESNKKH